MKKINSEGFALVEMVIVSAFVMGLLTLMYTNFYPMIGEYERRENYDNIESVYNTFLVKKMIELRKTNITRSDATAELECTNIIDNSGEYCEKLEKELGIEKMYIAAYDDPKASTDPGVNTYIENISKASSNFAGKYRVIVKYKVFIDEEDEKSKDKYKDTYQYASMGVNLG